MAKSKDRNGGKQRSNKGKGVVKSLSRLMRRKAERTASYAEACRTAGRPVHMVMRGHGASIAPAE